MQRLELIPGLNRFLDGLGPGVLSTGWSGLNWDEDFSQVQRRFPDSLESGASLKLSSKQGEVQKAWSITFGFNSSRQLNSVTLSFAGSRETADFAKISAELSRRFGAPVQNTETSQTWRKSGASFTLSRQPGGGLVLNKTV